MEDAARLRAIPLFSGLADRELAKLATIIERISYRAEEVIFREGDPGGQMFLIEEGRVRISRRLPGMGEEALAILDAGAVFGEMAVLDGSPRSADAVVHSDANLMVIDGAALEDLFRTDGELAHHVLRAMLRTVTGRLRTMNEKVAAVFLMARFL